ncbi:MAG TPA: hypothetical protein VN618_12870 [Solirubrobacteraceae bacterium]|nr:hypothetical protein [Solirubrobacteraceae bacterium]
MSAAAPAQLDGYEALVVHAELELELAGRGEIEGLAALDGRWDALVAELPARPPAAAASILERARLLHERTRVELMRLRDSLLSDAALASQAKRTAAGYGGEGSASPRVDRSA